MTNLSKSFRELRKNGYFAKQDFMCCQSCGWAAIPDEQTKKAIFYHAQDKADIKEKNEVYLAWRGNGKEIVEIFERNGLIVDWNGSENTRIRVKNVK